MPLCGVVGWLFSRWYCSWRTALCRAVRYAVAAKWRTRTDVARPWRECTQIAASPLMSPLRSFRPRREMPSLRLPFRPRRKLRRPRRAARQFPRLLSSVRPASNRRPSFFASDSSYEHTGLCDSIRVAMSMFVRIPREEQVLRSCLAVCMLLAASCVHAQMQSRWAVRWRR